jgi:hypothetical protein
MESVTNTSAETDFPVTWRWEEDGDEIDGTFVEIDEGPTAFGVKPIVVLEVAGEKRTLWLLETALRNKFMDEVARRPSGDLTVGERIVVRRGGMRESASGKSYRSFHTDFPDRPKRRAAQILGSTSSPEPEAVGEDEVPY